MKNRNRDLLVLLKTPSISEEDFEKHIDCLHSVAMQVENNETFCAAHELVARNRITSKKKRILKASAAYELKPFYFLINKN
jgi:hypothetical protein